MCGDGGGMVGKRRDYDRRIEHFAGEGVSRQENND
jgi:hypothetical protein